MNVVSLDFLKLQSKNWIPLDLNKVLYIIVHHIDAAYANPSDINQWHLNNGWSGGFGYNEYIRKDGTVYIGRGDNIGAQCAGMNSSSYGIACEGDYDVETVMPIAQFNSLVERIKFNSARFPNFLETTPHSRFVNTSCPGKYFPFLRMLQEINKLQSSLDEANSIDEEFKANLELLQSYGKISSPQYWLDNCKDGGNVDGLYAKIVLNKFAELLKSWY